MLQLLINNLDRDLQYAIGVEGKMDLESVINYDEVKNAIMEKVVCSSFSIFMISTKLGHFSVTHPYLTGSGIYCLGSF